MQQLTCPHCLMESQYGVRVCKGCQAEIYYGATSKEIKNIMGAAFLIGLFTFGGTLSKGPKIASIIGVGMAVFAYLAGVRLANKIHSMPRFFRRYFN